MLSPKILTNLFNMANVKVLEGVFGMFLSIILKKAQLTNKRHIKPSTSHTA